MYALAELERKLENLISIGKVVEVDYPAKKLRVNIEQDEDQELTSFWMPIPAEIGRNFKRWLPVRFGTQMILACPLGHVANAVPIGMLYTQDFDSPSTDEEIDLILFDDDSYIGY